MGKRQIGQLQPYEFVIAIMISDLASLPMQDNAIPLWTGIIPILTLLILQLCISFVVLKIKKFRGFFCGKPCVMIMNGNIIEENLRSQMYTLDDLLEALRLKGFSDVRKVQIAILENNGELSVIPNGEEQCVTKCDLGIKTAPGIVRNLIVGGCLIEENLNALNIDHDFLVEMLRKNDIYSIKDAFYCYVDEEGKFIVQKKKKMHESIFG